MRWLSEWLYNLRSAPPATARTVTRAESERARREAERRWQEEQAWGRR